MGLTTYSRPPSAIPMSFCSVTSFFLCCQLRMGLIVFKTLCCLHKRTTVVRITSVTTSHTPRRKLRPIPLLSLQPLPSPLSFHEGAQIHRRRQQIHNKHDSDHSNDPSERNRKRPSLRLLVPTPQLSPHSQSRQTQEHLHHAVQSTLSLSPVFYMASETRAAVLAFPLSRWKTVSRTA